MKRLALVALLTTSGCPKNNDADKATPAASPTSTAMTIVTETPAPTATAVTTATPEAKDVFALTYHWGGGLSPYHHYELTVRGDAAKFAVKPMRSEEKTYEENLSKEETALLSKLVEDVKFFDAGEQPRKVRIMDIGESTITVWKDGRTHTVKESGTTSATVDLKPLRKWLDERVRVYLEKSGAKPIPQMSPKP